MLQLIYKSMSHSVSEIMYESWSLSATVAFYIIFTWAPANLTWAQARVCPGLATPLLTFQKRIHAHKINPHEINPHEINSNEINFPRDQTPTKPTSHEVNSNKVI